MSEENFNPNSSVVVKIDRTAIEDKLMSEKMELQRQVDEMKRQDFERRKSALPEKYQNTVTESSIDSMEQLAKDETESEKTSGNRTKAHGVVGIPATPQRKGGYATVQDCYADIKAREMANDPSDPAAKEIMNQWFSNLLSANRNGEPLGVTGKIADFDNGKPISQIMNENLRRRVKTQPFGTQNQGDA